MHRFLATAAALAIAAAGCGTARTVDGHEGSCGSCHGFPPTTSHPAAVGAEWTSVECAACHATTLDAAGALLPGGVHQDGVTDVALPWHLASYGDPLDHAPDALARMAICRACHGADFGGGPGYAAYASGATAPSCNACHPAGWSTNCGFCHGNPPATGRHDKHVTGEGVGCATCHPGFTSTTVDAALHMNGTTDTAAFYDPGTRRCATCHGTGKGTW